MRPPPHRCQVPGCTTTIQRRYLMCRPHWFTVPKGLRDAVWATYREGQERGAAPITKSYLTAAQAACQAAQDREVR